MLDDGRPSPKLRSALRKAGWTPDRTVDLAGLRTEMDAYGYRMSASAASFLESLYGLSIDTLPSQDRYLDGADPLTVDTTEVGMEGGRDTERLVTRFGGHWFPIGTWLYDGDVYIEDGARMIVAAAMDRVRQALAATGIAAEETDPDFFPYVLEILSVPD
jgi:hypothetical protein